MNVRIVEYNKRFMFLCAILCIFLDDGAGLVILGCSLWILCTEKGSIRLIDTMSLFLIFLSIVWYVFMYRVVEGYSLGNDRSWVAILVSSFMLLSFYKHIGNMDRDISTVNKRKQSRIFYDVLYLMLFIYSANIIRTYLFEYYLQGLDPRLYRLRGMHENDLAIIVIFTFLIGWKTKHILSATLLAGLAILFMPSRTFTFYMLLFFVFYFFPYINKIIRRITIFDSYFNIIIFLVLFLFLFSAIWVLSLSWKYTLGESHVGIFETSNQGRFESILFAFRVIFEKKLYFKGIPVTYMEESDYSQMASMKGFHSFSMYFPHSSYLLMMVQYSVVVCFIYLYILSKVFDRTRSRTNDAMVLSYLIVAMIFHNMLLGGRLFIFLSILLMEEFETGLIRVKKVSKLV